MKLLVSGLILVSVVGSLLLWQRGGDMTARQNPALGPERTTRCMVWRAENGGATVWICGSVHVMRETDYPLPEPYTRAFAEAKTVVMELPPDRPGASPTRDGILEASRLPDGQFLDQIISPAAWSSLMTWCRDTGTETGTLTRQKPWAVTMRISQESLRRLGYRTDLGLEWYFATRLEARRSTGLETPRELGGILDSLNPASLETMLLRAINDDRSGKSWDHEMAGAWAEGDTTALDALLTESLRPFPGARERLCDARNRAWIPKIEEYLRGTETVMILVGGGHLAGPEGVISLLEKKGVRVTQMEYRTRRLPASAGRNNG